ncbi:MAG: hypothetical protein ACJAQT_002691 [Akkermansiaceae bacterium]|jgi:hypothetical protein
MKLFKSLALSYAVLSSSLLAQNADPLVFTVGNSYPSIAGKSHNYLLWQPGDVTTTYGKKFAVYGKDGAASSLSPYLRLGIQSVQTSPSAIQALLMLGAQFDHDAGTLPERIVALHAEAQAQPLAAGTVFPTAINIDVAQKLAQVMSTASTDPAILQSLISLGRAHPGVMMSMGHGFAIEVPSASTKTYEVREIGIGNTDIRAIGRVSLNASAPYSLPPSGRPFPNPHPVDPALQLVASAKDHLNVRLRWGMSNTLRLALPKAYGFNLYRVPKGATNPLTLTTEALALAEPGAIRVNSLPIAASDLFTDAEAANLAINREIFFYADDKNPPSDPFLDGETFNYFVAARDIAGHPGPLSPPTEVTMCDRLPPSQPSILSVDNIFDFNSADTVARTGKQHLRVVIQQVPELPAKNSATKYRVYRWHSATDWQRHGGDPNFNFIGEVAHVNGATTVFFDDDNAADIDSDYLNAATNGPDTGAAVATSQSDFNMGKTFWYTVRAVDAASCNPPNLSGHAGALYGVLRDRVGPDKPSGLINHCFCQPGIEDGQNFLTERDGYGVDEAFRGAVVRVNRIDLKNREVIFKKIRSFEVQIGEFKGQEVAFEAHFSRTYYFKGMSPFGEVVLPIAESDRLTIRVRIRLDDRTVSGWASGSYKKDATAINELQVHQFDGSVSTICRPVSGPPGFVPGHYPVGAGGVITGIDGIVNLTPSTKEVRVYRRVGHTASLQLVFKTAGDALPASVPWTEGGPVIANGVEVCYFAQLFDEHGNASPLVRIGCATIVNDDFGVPLFTDPEPLAPLGGQGVVKLSWFCDPVGIERFEVWVASETGGDPVLASAELTGKLDTNTNSVLTTPEEDDITFCIYQTHTIESGFGNGAEFSVKLQVPYGKKYYYAIRPVGAMIPDSIGNFSRPEGDFSNMVCSAYAEPSAPGQAVVPWPARPLPGTASITQEVSSFTIAEGPFYATALNPEIMRNERCSGAILVGALPAPKGEQDDNPGTTLAARGISPLSWLFRYRKQSDGVPTAETTSIRRFVVYRHQVASERFPKARPNLVQITPLIDRITYYDDPATGDRRIIDPFFTFKRYNDTSAADFFVPSGGTFSRISSTFSLSTAESAAVDNDYLKLPASFSLTKDYDGKTMWVRDSLPVTRGASYQYLIVHFTVRGEIARVIPTNIISH